MCFCDAYLSKLKPDGELPCSHMRRAGRISSCTPLSETDGGQEKRSAQRYLLAKQKGCVPMSFKKAMERGSDCWRFRAKQLLAIRFQQKTSKIWTSFCFNDLAFHDMQFLDTVWEDNAGWPGIGSFTWAAPGQQASTSVSREPWLVSIGYTWTIPVSRWRVQSCHHHMVPSTPENISYVHFEHCGENLTWKSFRIQVQVAALCLFLHLDPNYTLYRCFPTKKMFKRNILQDLCIQITSAYLSYHNSPRACQHAAFSPCSLVDGIDGPLPYCLGIISTLQLAWADAA